MSENSAIEWTDHTFNPWSGCAKVSPACTNCYAANLPPSMRRGAGWGAHAERVPASEAYWRQPIAWDKAAAKEGVRRRVFCASVADVFEARDDLDPWRERLWALIEATPHLDWLLLTKRPEEMVRRAPARWADGWPANVWAGTTVEDQRRADERIPHLLRVPARVRFLSCEPLLEAVDLTNLPSNMRTPDRPDGAPRPLLRLDALTGQHRCGPGGYWHDHDDPQESDGSPSRRIHWVIAGGESGRKARPSHPDWFHGLRDQCVAAGVPFFFKQWGEYAPVCWVHAASVGPMVRPDGHVCRDRSELAATHNVEMACVGKHAAGRLLDGRTWDGVPA